MYIIGNESLCNCIFRDSLFNILLLLFAEIFGNWSNRSGWIQYSYLHHQRRSRANFVHVYFPWMELIIWRRRKNWIYLMDLIMKQLYYCLFFTKIKNFLNQFKNQSPTSKRHYYYKPYIHIVKCTYYAILEG